MQDIYRVSDYVIDFLAAQGVKNIFFLPGGGAMFLNDALAKNKNIQGVACHHEQACTISADAYSRIKDHIGVAMVTTGPGGTNAITGVAGAWIESVPMIVISGQVKTTDLMQGSGLRQKGVQEVDIVSIVKSITKYAKTIKSAEEIFNELELAFKIATSGRQGPVWLDIPLDIQAKPIQKKVINKISREKNIEEIKLEDYQKIESLLKNSKKPLILAGHGVRLSGASTEFFEMVEQLKIPVVSTWNALDLMPFNHPLYVGRPGVVAMRAPNFAVQNCDLLITIGCRLDNIITAFNFKDFARNAKKIIVDIDENEIKKIPTDVELKLSLDAYSFIRQLKEIKSNTPSSWIERCQYWKNKYNTNSINEKDQNLKISHYDFVKEISRIADTNQLIVTGSSGLGIEFFYTFFENKNGQRIFLTSGLGSMGYGIPAAIGGCFSNDRRPMTVIESDGSFQLNLQELATIRAFNLPIKIIILNNNGYASIRNTQRNYFESRFLGTDRNSGLWMPEIENVAKAYEIPYKRISNPESLNSDLKSSLMTSGPIIIEIELEENVSLAPKVSAIPQEDGSIISMPLEDMSPLLPLEELQQEMEQGISLASKRIRNLEF